MDIQQLAPPTNALLAELPGLCARSAMVEQTFQSAQSIMRFLEVAKRL
jgi:hypothetical protein